MSRALKRRMERNDSASRLNRLMKDVEAKFHLKSTLVGDTGDLRREMLEEFLVRSSEFSQREVELWLAGIGITIPTRPDSEVKGLGRVHGERKMNPDGTWTREVPGVGRVKFGEPRRIH